ncbi:MAG: helix-hairpin-helix domain-containing protein [Mariprofundaceae bacterium]|nr:helix-hairpin-helix domain-containing protein [Mariprofundaceae bacterium]
MKIKSIFGIAFVALMMFAMPAQADDKVNINTATVEQLQQVRGIGPKTAAAIVEYRKEHGAFSDVDDLLKVKGIGEKKLEKIRDDLTIGKKKKDDGDHHKKKHDD